MNISEPFIKRPVATTLLTVAIALAGAVAFRLLPVSPLPQVDFPTISVSASLPGASPETMASAVATPLERQFGRIAGVTEMTSSSNLGSSSITLQFELNPTALNKYGIGLEEVRTVLGASNANIPKGHISNNERTWEVGANDQLFKAIDYQPLVIAYHNGSAVRIGDVGKAIDSVEDVRNAGFFNDK